MKRTCLFSLFLALAAVTACTPGLTGFDNLKPEAVGEAPMTAADGGATDTDASQPAPPGLEACKGLTSAPTPETDTSGHFRAAGEVVLEEKLQKLVSPKDRRVKLDLYIFNKQIGSMKDGTAAMDATIQDLTVPDSPTAKFDEPAKLGPDGSFTVVVSSFVIPKSFNSNLKTDANAKVTINGFVRNSNCFDGKMTIVLVKPELTLPVKLEEIRLDGEFTGYRVAEKPTAGGGAATGDASADAGAGGG
ncbi:MAG: hypothetical protein GMKNLPBB_00413 [Myxococcota bacterium]|nr:hypothetical protein [Myxococcota bacterium]